MGSADRKTHSLHVCDSDSGPVECDLVTYLPENINSQSSIYFARFPQIFEGVSSGAV